MPELPPARGEPSASGEFDARGLALPLRLSSLILCCFTDGHLGVLTAEVVDVSLSDLQLRNAAGLSSTPF